MTSEIVGFFIMGKRIEYQKGEKIGECIYLYDVEPHILPNGDAQRKACFKCVCEKRFISAINSVKSGATKSCGCKWRAHVKYGAITHGLSHKPLYHVWENIKRRCYKPMDHSYKKYGARGITMCDEWRNDFKAFYDYVTHLPHYGEKNQSLDRIDTNGNYEPGNLRWATFHEQSVNTRIRSDNTSGYVGVSFNKEKRKFEAYITVNKERIRLDYHLISSDGAIVRNNYIIEHGLTEYPIQEIKEKTKFG